MKVKSLETSSLNLITKGATMSYLGHGYDSVRQFNKIAGSLDFPVFDSDSEEVRVKLVHQLNLIQEELNETVQAIKDGNKLETLDGFCDMLYTVHGFGTILERAGYDVEGAYDEVCKNNLSKFPLNKTVAEQSLEIYGDSAEIDYNDGYDCYVIRRKDSGKVMKPCNYQKVNLKPFVPGENDND